MESSLNALPEKIGPEKIGPKKIEPEEVGPEAAGPETVDDIADLSPGDPQLIGIWLGRLRRAGGTLQDGVFAPIPNGTVVKADARRFSLILLSLGSARKVAREIKPSRGRLVPISFGLSAPSDLRKRTTQQSGSCR